MRTKEYFAVPHVNVLVHGRTGPEHITPPPSIELIKGLTENGATFIQLRDKGMSEEKLIALGMQIRRSLPPEIPLIINDKVNVALAIRDSGAKGLLGIHVGQKDMFGKSVRDIRDSIPDDMILGVSAATVEQARQAVKGGADYLGVGPLFPTTNKDDADPPIGLRGLEQIKAAFPEVPIIAIGGITKDNAATVMRFGADGVAVIGAVLGAEDPRQATKELLEEVIPQERVPRLTASGQFTQLDKDENFVGRTMSRQEAETTGNSPVVSVFLFRGEGSGKEVLLQQRASHKSRWPEEWESSMVETSQMNPDDPWEPEHPKATAKRGLEEELTVKDITLDDKAYYFMHSENGSSSVMTIYTANYDENIHGPIIPDPEEIETVEWVPVRQLQEMLRDGSRKFTQGFVDFVTKYPELF